MQTKLLGTGYFLLAMATTVRADAGFGGGARQRAEMFWTQRHTFAIDRGIDPKKVSLIIPRRLLDGSGRSAAPAPDRTGASAIAFACCFATGGLWLALAPRRVLLGLALPLALATILSPVRANPGQPFQLPWVMTRNADVLIDELDDVVRLRLPAVKR